MLRKSFSEVLVITVTVVGIMLFVVWRWASDPITPEAAELNEQVAFLSSELESVNTRLERLQAREEVLQREADVMRQANRLLREGEADHQAEISRLQTELDFYHRLAGTGAAQSGLDVYDIRLMPTGSGRVYRFLLTLTRNVRRAAIIDGRARIDLEGVLGDRPVTLYWSEISDGNTPEPSFRFKYYQQLEGYLTLPEGFGPTRLLITLESGDRRKPVQRKYEWEALLQTPGDTNDD